MQYYQQNNQNELAELQKVRLIVARKKYSHEFQWFRSVDRDGSGTITSDELANVAIGGIRLGIDTAIRVSKECPR